MVDDCEHLRPRAPILRQGKDLAHLIAALLEDLHVGVAEAIDRLELVPDEEELLAGEELDQLALEAVRVLELIHANLAEAQPLALADRLVVAEQIAGAELEILEVERRLVVLRRLVRALEPLQQLLEQGSVAGGDGVQRRLLDPVAGELVLLVALDRILGQVEQRLGRRVAVEELEQPRGVLCPARCGCGA